MSPRTNLLLIIAVVVVILVRMSVFTVDQRDYALKFQFGEIVKSDYKPGLHFKVPFVQNVVRYPNRIMNYEHQEEKFLTGEKKNLIVDYFVTWRVVDPAQYYRSVRGDEDLATDRLSAIIKEGIKAAISQRTVQEVVSAERSELMEEMLKVTRERTPELGVQVVDVRVKRIDLPPEVSNAVYDRMNSERQILGRQFRATGRERSLEIRADADRQVVVIGADAYRRAEELRGEGDATSAATYAAAYNKDPDFYRFYRSTNAYRNVFESKGDLLVLDPSSEFFKYLKKSGE